MNTRLQVEHPITELVTDVDLVREQLLIAAGQPLSLTQAEVVQRGHAIEVRVYAEDAARGFLPSAGRITAFVVPEGPGVRNDAGVAAGSAVTVDYDPMLAKLICFDRTREACIQRLAAAIDQYVVGGLATNLPFLRWLVGHEAFRGGDTTTAFIERYFSPEVLAGSGDDAVGALAAAVALQTSGASASRDPWRRLGAWRHAAQARSIAFVGHAGSIAVDRLPSGGWRSTDGATSALVTEDARGYTITVNGRSLRFVAWPARRGLAVSLGGRIFEFESLPPPSTADSARSHRHGGHAGAGGVQAPMTGKIVKVSVKDGDKVEARQLLMVMEAMKMEHTILAPYEGTLVALNVKAGDAVGAGDELAQIEAAT